MRLDSIKTYLPMIWFSSTFAAVPGIRPSDPLALAFAVSLFGRDTGVLSSQSNGPAGGARLSLLTLESSPSAVMNHPLIPLMSQIFRVANLRLLSQRLLFTERIIFDCLIIRYSSAKTRWEVASGSTGFVSIYEHPLGRTGVRAARTVISQKVRAMSAIMWG
ncbi:MAG: hypothetical protein MAG794_00589 [Gammaproteobacteria bacterium]|nr:hypothetical protein [Gammaproteobacteria bacterium]